MNNELIDTNYIEWSARKPNGGNNHRRLQAITNLKLLAYSLANGDNFSDDSAVQQWIKEAQQ